MNLLLAIIGGGIGSGLRYLVSSAISQRLGESFPWGTLLVNVSGSLAIGFFATLTAMDGRAVMAPGARLFFMVGIFGGYTTFSAFSLQTLNLVRDGQMLHASLNVLASVMLCLFAVWLGHVLAGMCNR